MDSIFFRYGREWRRGNFLVIVMLVGLLVMGGIGALHLFFSSSDLTQAVKSQDNLVNTANEDRLSSLREEAVKYVSADIYKDMLEGKSFAEMSAGLKGVFNRYTFVNYLNTRGISSDQINSDNVAVSQLTPNNVRNGSIASFPVIGDILDNNAVLISGLSVGGTNVTSGYESTRNVNLSYVKIPNSIFSWYHCGTDSNGTAPNLSNVSFSGDTGVLYFAKVPSTPENLDVIPSTFSIIVRGESGRNLRNIYDFSAMNSNDAALYDYINLSGDGGVTSKNYNSGGRFWVYPNLPQDLSKSEYILSFSRYSAYAGTNVNSTEQTATIPLFGFGDTTPILSIPKEDANEDLIEFFDMFGAPLLRMEDATVNGTLSVRWRLDLSGDSVWNATTESIALFLALLHDSLSGVTLPDSVITAPITSILHPSISLSETSNLRSSNLQFIADRLNTAGGKLTSPAGWRSGGDSGYFNFYLDNLAFKRQSTPDVQLYPDSTQVPILGKKISFSNGALGHFVRFPWIADNLTYFLIAGNSLSNSAIILRSVDSGVIYLGGDPYSKDWWKCTPTAKSALITMLPVCITEEFNTNKVPFLLATGGRLSLSYPQVSRNNPNDTADISIDSTPIRSELPILSMEPTTDFAWVNAIYSLDSLSSNIKANTVGDSSSPFYIPNTAVRNSVTCEAINLGHAEILCEAIICFYDPDEITPEVLSNLQYKINDTSVGTIGSLSPTPIFIPFGVTPTINDLFPGVTSTISKGYNSARIPVSELESHYVTKFTQRLSREIAKVGKLDKIARVYKYSRLYSPLRESPESLITSYGDGLGNSSYLKFYIGWCSDNAAAGDASILEVELGSLSE